MTPEKVVGWIEIKWVGWPTEVIASWKEFITREVSVEKFQRSVWPMGWCIFLLDNNGHIHFPFLSQYRNELGPYEYNVTVSFYCHPILIENDPIMPFRYMAHHTVLFYWVSWQWVCSWGWHWPQKHTFSLYSGDSELHCWRKSNSLYQGRFQSSDWYPYKMLVVLLYCHQFVSARFEFCKGRAQIHIGGSSKLMISKS